MEIQLKNPVVAILIGALSLIPHPSPAQVKKLLNVKGIAAIVNITPEEAKLKAIEDAKVEAMRLAGATEWIQSFNYLEKIEDGNDYEEFFHSLTAVQTMGSVTGWELVDEIKKLDDFNNLIYEVHINATVQLYKTKADPEFQISVANVQNVYKSEANLTFQVFSKKEGYLKVFLIDNNRNVSLLSPNKYEPSQLFVPEKKYSFPQSPYINYEVYTDHKEEINYLFFLYTRKDILYKSGSFLEFIEYVYSIEPQDRFVALEKMVIYR